MAQAATTGAELSDALQSLVRGGIVDRDHPDYEQARRVDNGSIDRYPELIVQCADAGDVIAALAGGREAGLDIAVRGGGHSAPGFGTVDDGLVIDLRRIRNVSTLRRGSRTSAEGPRSVTSTTPRIPSASRRQPAFSPRPASVA